jgi:hypothetical protein
LGFEDSMGLASSEPAGGQSAPTLRRWLSAWSGRIWAFFNSGFAIAVIGAGVAAILTALYTDRTANEADLASRRAELAKLVVELDLRLSRLRIVADQWNDRAHLPSLGLNNDGGRAVAIVGGSNGTITSETEFQNEHIASIISQAETDAGLPLTDKQYLFTFTDLENCAALAQTGYVLARIAPLVGYLKQAFVSRDIPIPGAAAGPDDYQYKVYAATAYLSQTKAEPLDVLTAAENDKESAGYIEACQRS